MNIEVKRDGKFEFYGEWPETVLADVKEAIQEVAWLIPNWALSVVVLWNNAKTEGIADARIEPDYRRFKISFGPQWLSLDAIERRDTLIHEFVHAHNLLIVHYARAQFGHLLPDGDKHRELILEGLRERLEQSTCDLAFCIGRRMGAESHE